MGLLGGQKSKLVRRGCGEGEEEEEHGDDFVVRFLTRTFSNRNSAKEKTSNFEGRSYSLHAVRHAKDDGGGEDGEDVRNHNQQEEGSCAKPAVPPCTS